MNRYRVAAAPKGWPEGLPFRLGPVGHDTDYGIGDEFDHEFDSPEDEQTNLESGLLELVPRTYRVIGDTPIYETAPGETFQAGLAIFAEAHLIDAGHIERVDTPATTKRTKKEEK